MNKMEILKELKKTKALLEESGLTVAYICVYGSQNYGLDLYTDTYKSDLDIKAIVVPSLEELVNNSKPISKIITIETGECDVKDIRSFFETYVKANPAYLECMFTDYYIIDEKFELEFDWFRNNAEDFVSSLKQQVIKALYGMCLEKQSALCKPYESKKGLIEKYGGDGKQSSHALRLQMLATMYFEQGYTYAEALKLKGKEFESYKNIMLSHKCHMMPLPTMKHTCDNAVAKIKDIRDRLDNSLTNDDYTLKEAIISKSRQVIYKKITKEIQEKK